MNYWLLILICYVVVAVPIFVCNFAQYIRCVYHEAKYERNVQNDTMHDNAKIRNGIMSLCKSANEPMPQADDPEALFQRYNIRRFRTMFLNIEGTFRYRAIHAWIWPFDFTQKLLTVIFKKRVESKLILFVLSILRLLLEWFILHVFDVLLAASGLDDNIAAFLLDLWDRIIQAVCK